MKQYMYVLITISFNSCASFNPGLTKDFKTSFTKEIIRDFNEKYENFSYGNYIKKNEFNPSRNEDLYQMLTDSSRTSVKEKKQYVHIRFPNESKVSIKFYSDTTLLEELNISGKLEADGFFLLKNTTRECHGIPYILGGCNIIKRRIGLSQSGDLIIEEAISNEGAFLLIIGSGYSYSSASLIKKIE